MTPLLFAATTLGAGCGDLDENRELDASEAELRNQGQDETGGPEQAPEADSGEIPGQYIVVMKSDANPNAAAAAVQAGPKHLYRNVFRGFAGPLNHGQVMALSQRKDVLHIEPDQVMTAADFECPDDLPETTIQYKTPYPDYAPAYGVDSVDQRELPYDNKYHYTVSGDGVEVYVFDTWMDIDHPNFGGRASLGYDEYPDEPAEGESCSGHATHVAGLVGSEDYGVAKDVDIISVEVLDCTGHGSWSGLLAGIDWVMENRGGAPAIANMSLSGGWSWPVNRAVNDLADSGVFVAVAAGNDDMNACFRSPAGAREAATVAANNSNYQRAGFSNYGSCVDIYACGTNIRSLTPGGGAGTGSGTSMSSPHVAGVAALYKEAFGDVDSDQLQSDLEDSATQGIISGNPSSTPNRLLHWKCSGSGK